MKNALNLNDLNKRDGGVPKQDDYSTENQVASVSIYFKNIKQAIIENINKADIVFGCVAWLTDQQIIDALCKKENFSIVVSEKSSINNLGKVKNHKNWIRVMDLEDDYNQFYTMNSAMHGGVEEDSVYAVVSEIRRFVANAIVARRHDEESEDTQALMHNKFLIFGKLVYSKREIFEYEMEYWGKPGKAMTGSDSDAYNYAKSRAKPVVTPYAVWTGSANFSINSELSLENGVLIHSQSIAESYFKEFCQIYLFSKSIIWANSV